jgi:hypothetical protein
MSTVAHPTFKAFAKAFENIYRSAICSGIRGDAAHQKRGGYHIGRKFQPATNYSVVRPDDCTGRGPDDAATAVDMSMSRTDMVLCTRRLIAVHTNDRDPRRKYINAFNGWLGTGDAQRWDMVARKVKYATPDHKWHIHLEIRRAYALNAVAHKAILSALRGETVAQYLISIGVKPYAPHVKVLVPRYPGRVLKRSTSTKPDPDVKLWQQRMVARGNKTIGKPDGRFGPKTEGAVRRYQKACKVGVDGQIGPKTWPLPWSRPLG